MRTGIWKLRPCSIGNCFNLLKPVLVGWSVPTQCISTIFSWKLKTRLYSWGYGGHQTPTMLNKMVFVDIMQQIRAQDCDSGRYPSFSTNLTGFRVGRKSWSTKPTENSWFPIEHVEKTTNSTKPTQLVPIIDHGLRVGLGCSLETNSIICSYY